MSQQYRVKTQLSKTNKACGISSQSRADAACPFCQGSNHCVPDDPELCWCHTLLVPAELLALLTDKDKSCICKNCILAFKRDGAAFKAKYRV